MSTPLNVPLSSHQLRTPSTTCSNQSWLPAEELRVLTNLKLKHHIHAHHYLGEAYTNTLLYKLWQKLHDTPQNAAQPDSRTRQATAKPLAHAQFSNNKFWSMPNVTSKEQEQVLKYRTDTIHTDKHTKIKI